MSSVENKKGRRKEKFGKSYALALTKEQFELIKKRADEKNSTIADLLRSYINVGLSVETKIADRDNIYSYIDNFLAVPDLVNMGLMFEDIINDPNKQILIEITDGQGNVVDTERLIFPATSTKAKPS